MNLAHFPQASPHPALYIDANTSAIGRNQFIFLVAYCSPGERILRYNVCLLYLCSKLSFLQSVENGSPRKCFP